MSIKNKLKILQWNIRSIKANKEYLLNFVFNEKPDLILLNETWLKLNSPFILKHYTICRQDRQDGYGGVATCIKNNIIFQEVKRFSSENTQYIITKISNFYMT